MVVCQWRTCGIFRYLVWPHTPAREDEGREKKKNLGDKTSQELRMLSSVTINCQITKIVMNSGSQLSEL